MTSLNFPHSVNCKILQSALARICCCYFLHLSFGGRKQGINIGKALNFIEKHSKSIYYINLLHKREVYFPPGRGGFFLPLTWSNNWWEMHLFLGSMQSSLYSNVFGNLKVFYFSTRGGKVFSSLPGSKSSRQNLFPLCFAWLICFCGKLIEFTVVEQGIG